MEERGSGIILRTRPLTETSLIVQWLTREQGRISCVAKGARRAKSPFQGKLDLFYEGDFTFVRSRRSELHSLREMSLRNSHAPLRVDLSRLHAAAYFTILVEQGSERETPIPELFELLQDALLYLDAQTPSAGLVFDYELKFLEFSGTSPQIDSLTDLAQEAIRDISPQSKFNKPLRLELAEFLKRAIGTALDRLPPQRERLMQDLLKEP